MRKGTIIVDENIEKNLKKAQVASYNAIYTGVGVWGRRALDYIFSDEPLFTLQIELEEGGEEGVNTYAKMIDRKASELRETIETKLFALPEYTLTGEYLKDLQKRNAVRQIIDEQIYNELIYVNELVRP